MIWRRSNNESYESSDTEDSNVDLEWPVNQAKEEENEDWGLPPDLRRMVEQEEIEMKPHQKETEVVNLGTGGQDWHLCVRECSRWVSGSVVRLPRHLRLILLGYAWFELRNCATQAIFESWVLPGKAKIEENETWDVSKDKGGSKETIRYKFFGRRSVPRMGHQYRASPKKEWKSVNMRGLSRSKLSQSKG